MEQSRSYSALAGDVLATPPACGPVRVVAVDGRAGSGKTTFAGRLALALGGAAQLLHTDDLLESGWADVRGFWAQLDRVLAALGAGVAGQYLPYDWAAGRPATTPAFVPVSPVLVVEGVTTAIATRGRRVLAVRVDCPRELRLARGVERDGEELRWHWVQWMTQEDEVFAAEGDGEPDLLVDGAARSAGERRYVPCS